MFSLINQFFIDFSAPLIVDRKAGLYWLDGLTPSSGLGMMIYFVGGLTGCIALLAKANRNDRDV